MFKRLKHWLRGCYAKGNVLKEPTWIRADMQVSTIGHFLACEYCGKLYYRVGSHRSLNGFAARYGGGTLQLMNGKLMPAHHGGTLRNNILQARRAENMLSINKRPEMLAVDDVVADQLAGYKLVAEHLNVPSWALPPTRDCPILEKHYGLEGAGGESSGAGASGAWDAWDSRALGADAAYAAPAPDIAPSVNTDTGAVGDC